MKIYLIGYSGRTGDELETIINRHDGILMDIRSSARSRIPDFSKRRLEERYGNWYMHVSEFGNVNYNNNEAIDIDDPAGGIKAIEFVAAYRDSSGWPGDLFIMCSCKDGNTCHRHVVGDLLRELGYEVEEYHDHNV